MAQTGHVFPCLLKFLSLAVQINFSEFFKNRDKVIKLNYKNYPLVEISKNHTADLRFRKWGGGFGGGGACGRQGGC